MATVKTGMLIQQNLTEKNPRVVRAEWEWLLVAILFLYPLRHIWIGLDLWDTGYNYANFQYMGLEHMDSMWLFSTYLATAVGHLLSFLPGAKTLLGMNLYTGLFVSLLAEMGYFFCTRKLKMPAVTAFLGEWIAVSLCWCPTALLYNYLTYVLFLAAMLLLYLGLAEERKRYLVAAGICLGSNVLVRFSNLPEAAMIVAVWVYDLALVRGKGSFRRTLKNTGLCLAGYVAALAGWFFYLGLRYGFTAYFEGVSGLFAMTEQATDYKADSMISGLIRVYVENLYWVVRIGVILAAGLVIFALAEKMQEYLQKRKPEKENAGSAFIWLARGGCVILGAACLVWLYGRNYASSFFYSYDSMLRPGVLFLILLYLVAVIRIFQPGVSREEKLLSGIVLLSVFLTAIGSNNGVYPSLNNLFLGAPYLLWELWRFIRSTGKRKIAGITVSAFPAKVLLIAFGLLCLIQFGGFGAKFVFAEATGVQDTSARVENNEVLKHIRMSQEKAETLTKLTEYVEANGLFGKEVLLYGNVPALSFYLQMPSAFNPWSDLRSYRGEKLEGELLKITEKADSGEELPVVILGNKYVSEKEEAGTDAKWSLLREFLEENEYEPCYGDTLVTVLRSGK